MDTLCGIGLPELIILALLGFVVIGPERSQDLALRSGRFIRTVMRSTWWREFNQVAHAIRDLPTTLVRMAELEEAQAEIRRSVREIEEEVNLDFNVQGQTGKAPRTGHTISDPWGIQHAAAGTRISRPASSSGEEAESGTSSAAPSSPKDETSDD